MNKTKLFNVVFAAMFVAAVMMAAIGAGPVLAGGFNPTKDACDAIVEKYGNTAHPEDEQWNACFVNGWVNWVFSADEPLPKEPPQQVKDAMEKGFVQLTEPWSAGCNNTLQHPKCSIGYLRMFSDWGTLRAFLAKGEFTQAGVKKNGPWTNGSLWFTTDFVQLANGEKMSAGDKILFQDGDIWLAFALDGEYPLPAIEPIPGNNVYALREAWRGGCIGNQPDQNCNIGQVLIYEDWAEMLKFLKDNDWTRGSVCANCKLSGVKSPTSTVQPTPTNVVTATAQPQQTAGAEQAPKEEKEETDTPTPPTLTPTVTSTVAATVVPVVKKGNDNTNFWLVVIFSAIAIGICLILLGRRKNRKKNSKNGALPPSEDGAESLLSLEELDEN